MNKKEGGLYTMSKETGKELYKYLVNYVVIDIETTGLSPKNGEIIEISAVKVRNEEIVEEFYSLVKPTAPIPFRVSELTGITDRMVEQSPDIKTALAGFMKFIGEDVIVCNYIQFCLGFLNKAAIKLFGTEIENEYIDTHHISKERLPKLSTYRLSALADYYGINVVDKSRLLTECRLVKEIYNSCI